MKSGSGYFQETYPEFKIPFGGRLLEGAPIAQHRLSDPGCTDARNGKITIGGVFSRKIHFGHGLLRDKIPHGNAQLDYLFTSSA